MAPRIRKQDEATAYEISFPESKEMTREWMPYHRWKQKPHSYLTSTDRAPLTPWLSERDADFEIKSRSPSTILLDVHVDKLLGVWQARLHSISNDIAGNFQKSRRRIQLKSLAEYPE